MGVVAVVAADIGVGTVSITATLPCLFRLGPRDNVTAVGTTLRTLLDPAGVALCARENKGIVVGVESPSG